MPEGAIVVGMDSEFDETKKMLGVLEYVKLLEQRIDALENYIYNNIGTGTNSGTTGGNTVPVNVTTNNDNIAKIIDTEVKAKIAELQSTIVGTDMVDEVKSRVLADMTLQNSIIDAVVDKLKEET